MLAGALRSIVGRLTVEEIIRDRAAFAAPSPRRPSRLTNQGLVLDTFQLQDIQAEGNYLADLGRPEAARAEQGGGDRRGHRPAGRRAGAAARRGGDRRRQPELALKQAEIQAETDAAEAEAAAAGPLAQAARDQDVLAAQEKVAERTRR